ncbi:nitrite reductase/ring-hydroxylating ferredoxin subunit [Pseudomonas frederiksbergensis]
MDHHTQVSLSRKILDLAEQGATSFSDSIFLNPVSSYTCPEHLKREQTRLFRSNALMVGLSCQLARPGDYLTDDLSGVPIAIVRTTEGGLSAFINVCRHRGARLLEGQGTLSGTLSCPYHGWVYDLHGKLRQLSPNQSFQGLQCAERNLTRLAVVERGGLIQVHPVPGQCIELPSLSGVLRDEIDHYDFQSFSHYETRLLRKSFNWKIVIETFLENWHFPFLHRQTVLPIFIPACSHFETFGPDARLIMPRRSLLTLRGQPQEKWDLLKHSLIIYLLFPNTLLLWQGDHLEVWRVFPTPDTPDQCLAEVALYTRRAATSARERAHWDKNMALLLETVEVEDFKVSEQIQKGFHSGAQQHLTFGKNEPALKHFHQMIQHALYNDGTH